MTAKLKSVKNIVVMWAVALITYIVVAGKADFIPVAQMLGAIPAAYIPCNVWQKKKLEGEK